MIFYFSDSTLEGDDGDNEGDNEGDKGEGREEEGEEENNVEMKSEDDHKHTYRTRRER